MLRVVGELDNLHLVLLDLLHELGGERTALLNDGSFALSGGGSMSSIGGVGPPLLGILVLGGWYLLRRDSRIYLVSCELPKLTSAVLAPLEHPG